jgi:hypothetical protein
MGLREAGSYFQYSLVNEVLNGLIMHDGVELYLDDCLVHATSDEEYLRRLRAVFERFRDANIKLNPAKCHLCLRKVEYVGHTINDKGLHFTRSKLDSVINFPIPKTKKQVKSFIGLANYFREHIRNHSTRIQPLQKLVDGYDKRHANQAIKWEEEHTAAFEDMKRAIDECPLLWFMEDESPIYLETDASDYGIGAYLYQKVSKEDGTFEDRPIGFISKSIPADRTSWDIPKKEGYAIFYALQKWEYLLRDRQFTIRTDHENLTRLRADHGTSKMVKRWFMAYQEFDIIDWEHVKGENNAIADALSRLVADHSDEHPAITLFHMTGEEIPTEAWNQIAQVHNHRAGHHGVQRTIDKLQASNRDWPKRREHVTRFVKLCPCCQKMSNMRKIIKAIPFTTSSYSLWDTISIDYIENLKPDEHGNTMIIVIIDNFSRFIDLYPTNSTKAEGAAEAIVNFSGKYATPQNFVTDGGPAFKSLIIKELMESLGSAHHLTNAHSKEQNALVERANGEVLRHLRNIIFDERVAAKWSKYLPLVQRIMNTTKHSSTNLTPAEIVFPSGVTVDKSILSNPPRGGNNSNSSYIRELEEAQFKIIAAAQEHLQQLDAKHIEERTSADPTTVFEAGSYVLAEYLEDNLRRGPPSKLLPFLQGPFQVVRKGKKGMYIVRDLVSLKERSFHMSKLKPYNHDDRNITPLQAAVADSPDEFIVEQIIDMEGDVKRSRKLLKFKIRWAGYSPEHDTWEPWDNCKNSTVLQEYLRSHPNRNVRRLAKVARQDNDIS